MNTRFVLACTSLVALLPATSEAMPTIYTYTGAPFEGFLHEDPPIGRYTPEMRITGSLTLADAIAADSGFSFDNTSPQLLAFSFSDGLIIYNNLNVETARFSLTTNPTGDGMVDWFVRAYRGRRPPDIEDSGLTVHNPGGCGITACDSALTGAYLSGYAYASNSNIGAWTVTAVPEPETYALFLAGIALVGFAAHRRSKLPT